MRRLPNSFATRSCISAAALFVNVTARIRSGSDPCRISSAIRNVTTRVLPVPAPASTKQRSGERRHGLSVELGSGRHTWPEILPRIGPRERGTRWSHQSRDWHRRATNNQQPPPCY